MEELNAVTIYWLISIGLFIGLIMDLSIQKKGLSMKANIFWGAAGSVITGVLMIILGVFAPLIYAALGSVSILFFFNAFSFEPEEKPDAKLS